MKKFNEFILNEANDDVITLSQINDVIQNIFNDTKVSSVNSTYEKSKEGQLKLVITLNNLFYEKTNIIHNKIVFDTDDKKRKIIGNYFYYLYDINCKFKKILFNDIADLETKINSIFNNRKFGDDLIILSDLNVLLNSKINNWLVKNNIKELSIYSITYNPIVDNIPCESMTFTFNINIDDIRFIRMNIKKSVDNEYILSFSEGDWFNNVTIDSLKAIPQTVGQMIKKYIL